MAGQLSKTSFTIDSPSEVEKVIFAEMVREPAGSPKGSSFSFDIQILGF